MIGLKQNLIGFSVAYRLANKSRRISYLPGVSQNKRGGGRGKGGGE